MKRTLLLSLLSISFLVSAQTYAPFPTDSAEWKYELKTWGAPLPVTSHKNTLIFDGDSTINGITYTKLYNPDFLYSFTAGQLMVRDDTANQKVYFRLYSDEMFANTIFQDSLDHLLYDFSKNAGDSITPTDIPGLTTSYYVRDKGDTIINGQSRLYLDLAASFGPDDFWISGIGSAQSFFRPIADIFFESFSELYCFTEKSTNTKWEPLMDRDCAFDSFDLTENGPKTHLTLYPNPVEGSFRIQRDGTNAELSYYISDMYGKVLRSGAVLDDNELVDVQDLSPGPYLIIFEDSFPIKFVIR